jgi:hypothetical protein
MGLEAEPEALPQFKAWIRVSSAAKQLQWLPELLLCVRVCVCACVRVRVRVCVCVRVRVISCRWGREGGRESERQSHRHRHRHRRRQRSHLHTQRERERERNTHYDTHTTLQKTAPTNPQTSSNSRGDQDNQTSDRPGDVARSRSSTFGDASPQKRAAGALARHRQAAVWRSPGASRPAMIPWSCQSATGLMCIRPSQAAQ